MGDKGNDKPEGVVRDWLGRYDVGTVGGPGNPFGRHVARNRKIFLAAFSEEQVMALVQKLFAMAMDGDLGAMKIILAIPDRQAAPRAEPGSRQS
jgi:hypothetical protein